MSENIPTTMQAIEIAEAGSGVEQRDRPEAGDEFEIAAAEQARIGLSDRT